MMTADPDLPPYDSRRISSAPIPERVRLACRTWAAQINPNQRIVMALYRTKYVFGFMGGWAIFYELCGFGSSWGPMNALMRGRPDLAG